MYSISGAGNANSKGYWGGYSMGRADLVRRAMGKKKMDIMEEERRNFIYGQVDEKGDILIKGAIRNGVDEASANRIYDLMIDLPTMHLTNLTLLPMQ